MRQVLYAVKGIYKMILTTPGDSDRFEAILTDTIVILKMMGYKLHWEGFLPYKHEWDEWGF